MSTFYERPKRSNELYHWGMKKGAKAEYHKYVARIPQGKGYRYFYTNDEYRAYLTGKRNNLLDKVSDAINKTRQNVQNAGQDAAKEAKKDAKEISDKGKTIFTEYMRNRGSYDELKDGNHPKSFDDIPRRKPDYNEDADMMDINPKRSIDPKVQLATDTIKIVDQSMVTKEVCDELTTRYGRLNNCAYCTLAYDMRRKGYDVEASSVSKKTANTPSEIESWYKNGHFKVTGNDYANLTSLQASNKITQELSKEGPGARGQFCVYWRNGGGHSISYEVDSDRNVVYRDCQHDRVMRNNEINDYLSKVDLTTIHHMRTDNLEYTDKALHGVVVKKRRKK